MRRDTLPRARVRRAFRVMVPGIGFALTVTFSLSALRLVTPGANIWLPLVLFCGAIGFFIGYLTPTPVPDRHEPWEIREREGEPELDLAGLEAQASRARRADDATLLT